MWTNGRPLVHNGSRAHLPLPILQNIPPTCLPWLACKPRVVVKLRVRKALPTWLFWVGMQCGPPHAQKWRCSPTLESDGFELPKWLKFAAPSSFFVLVALVVLHAHSMHLAVSKIGLEILVLFLELTWHHSHAPPPCALRPWS